MEWRDRQLYLLFSPDLCRDDPWSTLETCLDAGVDIVQWRVKEPDPRAFRHCFDLCAGRKVPVIVNDDVLLARHSRAAGAHVGQDDRSPAQARELLLEGQMLGVSTHDIEQARRAVADGADYLGIGPCFPTETKGYTEGLEDATIREVLSAVRIPVFAIGGITPERLPHLRGLGVERVAVSSAVLAAEDPAAAVAALRAGLSSVP